MPVFTADYLQNLCHHVFMGAGAPEDEAQAVAAGLVDVNLAGHDSHGVINMSQYINRMKLGQIVPGAPFEIERETSTTARIRGHWGFGFVVTPKAVALAVEKAKAHGLAAVTIYEQSHIGRLSPYPLMATREGMAAMMFTDSGRGPKTVAPFGGREPRLGTNPLCIAVPSNKPGPMFIDIATSAVAGGKLNVARSRHEQVPLGWIIDKDGNPTTNPEDRYQGGASLPLGGDQGHKGYGLSFMVEVFSGILTTLGWGIAPTGILNDGAFFICWKIEAFMDLEEFKQQTTEFADFVKSSAPAAGFKEVLYPGEHEYLTEQERRRDGIYVEDDTWNVMTDLVREYGVEEAVGTP